VQGRNDGILRRISLRAYFGLNNVVDGYISSLHYYETPIAHNLDSFNKFRGTRQYIPFTATSEGDGPDVDHLRPGRIAPPSQSFAPITRGAARRCRANHAHQRAAIAGRSIAGSQITFTAGQVRNSELIATARRAR